MKFIIVDSDTNRQRTLRSILSSLGYRSADVDSAQDGNQALDSLKKNRYDLAFLSEDLGIGGSDVLAQIRSNATSKNLPVVIISAEPSQQGVMDAVQAGANGFLGFPFSVNDVEVCLKQAMKKSQP